MEAMFDTGNLDVWNHTITQYLPTSMVTVRQTLVPIVEAALLSLLGNSKEFARKSGNVAFKYDAQGIPLQLHVELVYDVAAFAVAEVDEDAVVNDQNFINGYITQVPSLRAYPTKIDTDNGTVTITGILPIGYQTKGAVK